MLKIDFTSYNEKMNTEHNQEQINNFEKCLQEANQEIEKKYWKITNRLNRWLPTERFKRYWLSRCWNKWTTFSKNDLINKNFVGFLVDNGVLDYKNQDFLRRYDHFIDYDFEDYMQDHARVNIVLMIIITQEDPLLMLNNMIKWMSSVANTMVELNSKKTVSNTVPPKQDKRKKHFWRKWRFCTCCWIFKSWSNFPKDSKTSWYKAQCKECIAKKAHERYILGKESKAKKKKEGKIKSLFKKLFRIK